MGGNLYVIDFGRATHIEADFKEDIIKSIKEEDYVHGLRLLLLTSAHASGEIFAEFDVGNDMDKLNAQSWKNTATVNAIIEKQTLEAKRYHYDLNPPYHLFTHSPTAPTHFVSVSPPFVSYEPNPFSLGKYALVQSPGLDPNLRKETVFAPCMSLLKHYRFYGFLFSDDYLNLTDEDKQLITDALATLRELDIAHPPMPAAPPPPPTSAIVVAPTTVT